MDETKGASRHYQGYSKGVMDLQDLDGHIRFQSEYAYRFHFRKRSDWGERVIDFGGRLGEKTRKIKNVTVVEIDAKAREWMASHGIRNLESLEKMADHSVDTVYCAHVLEHLENPSEYLKLFHRKLKKNGALIIAIPKQVQLQMPSGIETDRHGHIYAWNQVNINTLLERMGFRVQRNTQTTWESGSRAIGWDAYERLMGNRLARNAIFTAKFGHGLLSILMGKNYTSYGEIIIEARAAKQPLVRRWSYV
ncbi:MAG: methyltransferase domain-containing protein [Candidatus Micrarchaeia archaeon]